MGNGQGYYDRLLERVRPACPLVALCYESQLFDEILVGPHDVQLDDGAGTIIRSRKTLIAAGSDKTVKSGLAITKNGTGSIAGAGIHCMLHPFSIACSNQKLDINTFERLGISVVYKRRHQALPFPV